MVVKLSASYIALHFSYMMQEWFGKAICNSDSHRVVKMTFIFYGDKEAVFEQNKNENNMHQYVYVVP